MNNELKYTIDKSNNLCQFSPAFFLEKSIQNLKRKQTFKCMHMIIRAFTGLNTNGHQISL